MPRVKKLSKLRYNYRYRKWIRYGNYHHLEHKYHGHIYRVFKQIHPKVNISQKSINILNSFVADIFDRIIYEACILLRMNDKVTLSAREIQTATMLCIPQKEMQELAIKSGYTACSKFCANTWWRTNPFPRGQRVYRHKRAGLIFPVGRIAKYMKLGQYNFKRLGGGAPVYMAAVLQYLVTELSDISVVSAQDNNRKKVTPRDIMIALRNDEEFQELLRDCWISFGGTMPGIHSNLLRNSKKELKAIFI